MADNFKTISDLDISFKEFMPGQVIQSTQFNDDMKDIEEKVNEVIGQHNGVANTVVDHLNNKNNPHEVTAHQVGTYTTTEIDEFIKDIKHGHLYDKSITNSVLANWSVNFIASPISRPKADITSVTISDADASSIPPLFAKSSNILVTRA